MHTHHGRSLYAIVVICLFSSLILLSTQLVQSQTTALPVASTGAPIAIHFNGVRFTPDNVTLAIGDTVEWWNDSATEQILSATGVLSAPGGQIFLPIVHAALRAESAAQLNDPAASDTEPILFSQPFPPGGVVRYTVTGVGQFMFGLVGQTGPSGQVTVVGVGTPTPTNTPTSIPTSTATATPSTFTIAGYVQKGPFILGTEITVRELDDSFVPTGRTFTGSIDDNTGRFSVRGALNHPYVELSANGFYFNEVSGSLSTAPISLLALADLRDTTTINVNLLTHLERARVLALVDSGVAFRAAKTQAQREVLTIFNLADEVIGNSETLDISQAGEGNAILLAISVVLQSDRSEAQLTELMSTLSSDLRTDGVLDSAMARQRLMDGMEYVKPRRTAIRTNIVNRYAELGASANVPNFEAYVFALDTVAPAVISTAPDNGADQEVHTLTIVFSELMQHATLNDSTIRLLDEASNRVVGTVSASDSNTASSVVFTPAGRLMPGVHELTIGVSVQDLAGNGLAADVVVGFTNTPLSELSASSNGPTRLGSVTVLTATVPGNNSSVVYSWNLGDGESATGSSVSHTYPAVGTYLPTVIATNGASLELAGTTVNIIDREITHLEVANSGPTRLDDATEFTATILDGSNVAYVWDFGDGAADNGARVSHTYAAVGFYKVTLTANNGVGQVMTSTHVSIIDRAISGLQVANSGPTPIDNITTFTATVLDGSNVTYAWNFGDGATGSGAKVSHTYAAVPHAYTATLTAINGVSLGVASTPVYVIDRTIVSLQAATSGATPLGTATSFSATLLDGSNVTYVWSFGDGAAASGARTSHTYGAVGDYIATVTATNGVGQVADSAPVSVMDRAIIGLQASNGGVVRLDSATAFTATIMDGSNVIYAWDFGDGSIGSGAQTNHVYAGVGAYTATVTATNSLSQVTASTTVTIIDREITGLRATNSGPSPLGAATAFTSTILDGSNVAYTWDFGDGATDSGAQVSHTYAVVGPYTAIVTATNSVSQVVASTTVTVIDQEIQGLRSINSDAYPDIPTIFSATLDSGTNVTYAWSFGDGTVGSGIVVTHTYGAVGRYTIAVTATNSISAVSVLTTITVFPRFKLLAVGGFVEADALASSELYDPVTGWSTTGTLSTERHAHTATRLPDGKVLIAGGHNNTDGGALTSVELYDPATGTWGATGNLNILRYLHTAVLLPNGKVLVMGGYDNLAPVASAELYDPTTGNWSNTGNLNTARYFHTATLLRDGTVLVVGSRNTADGSAIASTELYSPTTGTWSTTGSLNTARYLHTATLLPDGRVLVVGGSNKGELTSAESYDPATGIWSTTGSLNRAQDNHTATLLPNGKVLVVGGKGDVVASAELYDPATGIWSTTGSLSTVRYVHTATLLPNGKVLVVGGYNGLAVVASAELYDPTGSTWSDIPGMSQARYYHTATLLDGVDGE